MNSESTSVFGIECFSGTRSEAAELVVSRARSGEGGAAVFANAHVTVTATRDPVVASALAAAWAVFPDGAPVAWLLRRSGATGQRVAGPDVMPLVLERGQASGLRHFFFGSTPAVVSAVAERVRAAYPAAQVVGHYAPPYGEEDSADALVRIKEARPHIVWVGLGAPKQELWAARHAESLAPSLIMCVGAAFDFFAGTRARAPEWMQRFGLEWLHRLALEPRRLGWRYVDTNTRFLGHAARERIRNQSGGFRR